VNDFIQTESGRQFRFLQPSPSEISIQDIASALSKMPRFGGHSGRFYSVAQHSLICAHMAPNHLKLEALMHDAHEAYVGDVPTPLKALLPDYQNIEQIAEKAVRIRFGLPVFLHPDVKIIDQRVLASEIRAFHLGWAKYWPHKPYDELKTIESMEPEKARSRFLSMFYLLTF
jgi:hypothetical protein